jgi:hypothetical protein
VRWRQCNTAVGSSRRYQAPPKIGTGLTLVHVLPYKGAGGGRGLPSDMRDAPDQGVQLGEVLDSVLYQSG